MSETNLKTPIESLFMVGPAYTKRLKKLNLSTVEDLLHHYPSYYKDFSLISPIGRVQEGETVTVTGKIVSFAIDYRRRGRIRNLQKVVVDDGTGKMEAVWFNQPFLKKALIKDSVISLSGRVKADWHKLQMTAPEFEVLKPTKDSRLKTAIHTGRLIPIYPETRGVSSKWLRSRIAPLLKECQAQFFEFLPEKLRQEYGLINFSQAINQIHFPQNKKMAELARLRLAFDELFLLQLNNLKTRQEWQEETVSHRLEISKFKEEIGEFYRHLPFELTRAQRRAVSEILTDLGGPRAMNRLLQGDVGSGKTVVSAIAIYLNFLNGFQSLLMAPTEILTFQHLATLEKMLAPARQLKIGVYTRTRKTIGAKKADVLVGTHALLNLKLDFERVGLVVVDEQHKFGVVQRARLKQKGVNPHLLTMTATPIPRTVALTVYGQLDLSIIDEMPPGRLPVKTFVVPKEKRGAAYGWIKEQIKGSRRGGPSPEGKVQSFIICPLIEESDKETLQSARAATVEYERLKAEVFPDLRLGLLHGRLKSKEKDETVQKFRQGKLDILVSTPVVEVGMDIPGASLILIETAERFGLAQLHQLRGRVGRRGQQGYCLLFTESGSPSSLKRLKLLEDNHHGLVLAEEDMRLRGPGQVYGTAQHGHPFAEMKLASVYDFDLIEKTRKAARWVMEKDPSLEKSAGLKEKLLRYRMDKVEPN